MTENGRKRGHQPVGATSEPEDDEKRHRVLDVDANPEEYIAFDSKFVKSMLSNVKVLMVGDSLMRGVYKDLLTWLQSDVLSDDIKMKRKSEPSYLGDRQVDISLLSADKVFRQAREYQTDIHLLQFVFTTRVMRDDIEQLLQQMMCDEGFPDVILINSMIWDLTRYFNVSSGVPYMDSDYQRDIEIDCLEMYLDRTAMLLRRLRALLPPHTQVVWVNFPHCRPSIGNSMQNHPMAAERNHFIRSVMIDGAFRIAQVVRAAGYDVLDLGFYMRNHSFYSYQKDDGMHWWPCAVRLMTQLVLQYLAKSWGIDTSEYLTSLSVRQDEDEEIMLLALKQLSLYAFASDDVPDLQDRIASETLKRLETRDDCHIQDLLQMVRVMMLFGNPFQEETKKSSSTPKPTTRLIDALGIENQDELRLAPLIETEQAEELDEMATHLSAMIRLREKRHKM